MKIPNGPMFSTAWMRFKKAWEEETNLKRSRANDPYTLWDFLLVVIPCIIIVSYFA